LLSARPTYSPQSHDKWGEAGSLDNIGFTYLKLNDLDKAIDYCKQSLAICQGTGDKKGEANALLHLGKYMSRLGYQTSCRLFK
jgi:tetratricopeptide (TPR) repeat protein